MPRLLGLIFDLDGTLVDSAADLRQAVNTLITAQGRRALSLDEIKAMVGDGLQTLVHRAFAATGVPLSESAAPALMTDFLRLYQTQKATPDMLYPQALDCLKAFRTKDVKIGLCTNKLYGPTLDLLNAIEITPLFDFIAGSDTFPVYKPHPGHVLGVAHALQVPVSACAMIGDSLNDIRAAQGANMAAIAVAHGYGANVHTLGADAIIDGFAALPDALRHLGFDLVA